MNRLRLPTLLLLFVVTLWLLGACGSSGTDTPTAAQEVALQNEPSVEILAQDSSLKIVPSGQKIALQANYNPKDVSIQWQLTGSGRLLGETDPVIQYEAPKTIEAEEQVMVIVTITDRETKRTAKDTIVITLVLPTPTPKPTDTPAPPPPDTPTPTDTPLSTPTLDSTESVLPLDPAKFITQTVSGGGEFFLDTTSGAVPNLPIEDGVDLSGYILEFIFQGGDGRDAQLFFKNPEWKNVYCFPMRITGGQPIRCDPAVDKLNVKEFDDFTHIYAVGAKIWGGTQDVKIVSARLIRANAPDLSTPTPTSGSVGGPLQSDPASFIVQGQEFYLDVCYGAILDYYVGKRHFKKKIVFV